MTSANDIPEKLIDDLGVRDKAKRVGIFHAIVKGEDPFSAAEAYRKKRMVAGLPA